MLDPLCEDPVADYPLFVNWFFTGFLDHLQQPVAAGAPAEQMVVAVTVTPDQPVVAGHALDMQGSPERRTRVVRTDQPWPTLVDGDDSREGLRLDVSGRAVDDDHVADAQLVGFYSLD